MNPVDQLALCLAVPVIIAIVLYTLWANYQEMK